MDEYASPHALWVKCGNNAGRTIAPVVTRNGEPGQLKCIGKVELEYAWTYSRLKSRVTSALSNATTATVTHAKTAYAACAPLAIHRSLRQSAPKRLVPIA